MEERALAIGQDPIDRFLARIREIVDGEKDWPASTVDDPQEIEAQRQRLTHELFAGAELVDLVGHSTPIHCYLKLGDWVLDSAGAERLASYLPGSVKEVRLIGCSTASTEEGRAAAAAFTRRRLVAFGTLNKVYSTHFDKGGVRKGIRAPSMRGFFPDARAADPLPASGGTPDRDRSRGLLVWLGRGPWRALSGLFRKILPASGDPRSRIAGLLQPGGDPMSGLLTEPLLTFEIEAGSEPWTLEVLFDFECARFYPSAGSAGDRDLVYEIRGFGQAPKTPLEAYLERGPRGVTLLDRHEEAGDRCILPPGPGLRRWLVFLVGAVGVALAILLALLALHVLDVFALPKPPDALPDAMAGVDDGGVLVPSDAPPDGGSEPPSCATSNPTARYTGFVNDYRSPREYGSVTCEKSLLIQIDNYSPLYVGTGSGGTFVNWDDAAPPTRHACEAAWVWAALYRQISGKWKLISSKQHRGSWGHFSGTWKCALPGVGWNNTIDEPDPWIAGSNYRIVATARMGMSPSDVTRKFHVYSLRDGLVE